jgi:hypothetical protein
MKNCIFILLILSSAALAKPIITTATFLNTQEPERMCDSYIRATYGEDVTCWTEPSAGALVRVKMNDFDRCAYIFCDAPTHRLLVFSLDEDQYGRTPKNAKSYGRQIDEPDIIIEDSAATQIQIPNYGYDSTEYFFSPVDVAVSSCGRYYDPENDFIYALDQGNHRIVRLTYDADLDSLFWRDTFGEDDLVFPTALDCADYGDSDPGNDDIYVTDAGRHEVLRFSASGEFETSHGSWGYGIGNICYPSGIAVSTSSSYPKCFYVTDSHSYRIVRYYSDTNGPILAQWWHIFPHWPMPLINGVDTDAEGNVYVLDSFNDNITVLTPSLTDTLMTYGSSGHEPGQFDYPQDIYIDGNEMQVCEIWGDYSGISTLNISDGLPRQASNQLPNRFFLYQNYPNPFNSNTTIMFDIPETENVEMVIYDILGRKVITLINEKMSAGSHRCIWNGRNQSGRTVASGVYFYMLRSADRVISKRLLLLK